MTLLEGALIGVSSFAIGFTVCDLLDYYIENHL